MSSERATKDSRPLASRNEGVAGQVPAVAHIVRLSNTVPAPGVGSAITYCWRSGPARRHRARARRWSGTSRCTATSASSAAARCCATAWARRPASPTAEALDLVVTNALVRRLDRHLQGGRGRQGRPHRRHRQGGQPRRHGGRDAGDGRRAGHRGASPARGSSSRPAASTRTSTSSRRSRRTRRSRAA